MGKPLQVCCVTDGKPGHRTQLAGLVQALGEVRPVAVSWLDCSAALPGPVPLPELILAAGHRTHWPALRLKYASRAPLVVLMKPSLPRWLFDLCVIPEHDGVKASQRVLLTRGMLNDIRPATGADPGRGLLLLGGPSKHHGWSESAILEELAQLRANLPDVSWQASTSRRTPAATAQALSAMQDERFEFTPFEDTDRDWLRQRMQECGVIWVSEDSASMVYEALSAGARVGVLAVPRKRRSRVSEGLDALVAEGRVTSLEALASQGQMPERSAPLEEAARVAQYLSRWLNEAGQHRE